MSISTRTRTKSSVIAPSPLVAYGGRQSSTSSMTPVIAKLASLRERYLIEMIAAREQVKKNFLA